MNHRQRKYIEGLCVLIMLFVVVWHFQDNDAIARIAFIPAVIYFVLNHREIRSIEQVGPTPKEIIENSPIVRALVIAILSVEIIVSLSALLSGYRVDVNLIGFGVLLALIIGPILPAILVSQVILYRRLGSEYP